MQDFLFFPKSGAMSMIRAGSGMLVGVGIESAVVTASMAVNASAVIDVFREAGVDSPDLSVGNGYIDRIDRIFHIYQYKIHVMFLLAFCL